jgi:hypothetical protein
MGTFNSTSGITMKRLGMIYREFGIYPLGSYEYDSPVKVYQNLFSSDYYGQEIAEFSQVLDFV